MGKLSRIRQPALKPSPKGTVEVSERRTLGLRISNRRATRRRHLRYNAIQYSFCRQSGGRPVSEQRLWLSYRCRKQGGNRRADALLDARRLQRRD